MRQQEGRLTAVENGPPRDSRSPAPSQARPGEAAGGGVVVNLEACVHDPLADSSTTDGMATVTSLVDEQDCGFFGKYTTWFRGELQNY